MSTFILFENCVLYSKEWNRNESAVFKVFRWHVCVCVWERKLYCKYLFKFWISSQFKSRRALQKQTGQVDLQFRNLFPPEFSFIYLCSELNNIAPQLSMFLQGVYLSVWMRVVRMCPQVTAILCHGWALCVCVRELTLLIKFKVPAVNFIGGVKARPGWLCIFRLCVPRLSVEITACKDKMRRSLKYVTQMTLFTSAWKISFIR